MSTLRGLARALALGLWIGVTGIALLLGELLGAVSRRARERAQAASFRTFARGAARIVGLRIAVEGVPPTGAFFLVANHLSYLDVVVLAATVDATFVAKADVAAWPVIGRLCRAVGTVFIDRTRKRDLLRVLPILEERLRAGGGVVVFPEGTTSDGSAVLPFRSSLFAAAVRNGVPAHVATLTYATPADAPHPSRAVCWWGDTDFAPHLLALLRMRGCAARLGFARHPIRQTDRKRLARATREEIARRFVPVRRGEITCPLVPCPPTPTSMPFAREPRW